MKLSKYFTLEELIASQYATRHGIDNYPRTPDLLVNLTRLAKLLDIVRDTLGKPVYVSSGYRCQALNDVISTIGRRSTHILGLAADIVCPQYGTPFEVFQAIRSSGLKYDQLILEFSRSPSGWVHLGFDTRMRQQALSYDGKTYTVVT